MAFAAGRTLLQFRRCQPSPDLLLKSFRLQAEHVSTMKKKIQVRRMGQNRLVNVVKPSAGLCGITAAGDTWSHGCAPVASDRVLCSIFSPTLFLPQYPSSLVFPMSSQGSQVSNTSDDDPPKSRTKKHRLVDAFDNPSRKRAK